jgi:8-oxo-dGTP pyrophosphatase MutT (NUDIX family)
LTDNDQKIVEPRDAATVILMREQRGGKGPFEILLVRRHARSRFCSEFHVYPGGVLDDADWAPEMESLYEGLDRAAAGSLMTDLPPLKALGSWAAGIRETFEEVGILLANDSSGSLISLQSPEDRKRFLAYRKELNNGSLRLRDVLEAEGLKLAADRLFYFSHWITPEALPLRYNVRFFVARAPQCQEALHDGYELTDHAWLTPDEALQAWERGTISLVLPTISTLAELTAFKTIDEVIKSTEGKNIQPILTRMEIVEDNYVEIMPDGSIFGPSPV